MNVKKVKVLSVKKCPISTWLEVFKDVCSKRIEFISKKRSFYLVEMREFFISVKAQLV